MLVMTQHLSSHPASPASQTETPARVKKMTNKRVTWSQELTSVRLITPEVKTRAFTSFPIPEEEESELLKQVEHLL